MLKPHQSAMAAATDAKILAARATFPAHEIVSAKDLAGAAEVSKTTALTSYRRIMDRGGWPYAPLSYMQARKSPSPPRFDQCDHPFVGRTARPTAPGYLIDEDPYRRPPPKPYAYDPAVIAAALGESRRADAARRRRMGGRAC